jgi:glycosyltransferase involved in cell wall biosynthesis
MMAGFDFASGEIVVPMDADLQNDPEDIPRLLAKLDEGYDVCSGWRKFRKDNIWKKRVASKIANKLISKISGVKLKDYGCTLKAYRKSVIKGVRLYGEMHRFIPIYASWEGAKISEISVNHDARIFGKSSYGLERTFKVLLDLIVIVFLDNWAVKPIHLFGGFGFFNFIISFLSMCYASYLKFFKGISFIQTPLPLLSTMTFVTGTMCILMGLLAEMIMRTYYETQKKKSYLIKSTRNIEGVK